MDRLAEIEGQISDLIIKMEFLEKEMEAFGEDRKELFSRVNQLEKRQKEVDKQVCQFCNKKFDSSEDGLQDIYSNWFCCEGHLDRYHENKRRGNYVRT